MQRSERTSVLVYIDIAYIVVTCLDILYGAVMLSLYTEDVKFSIQNHISWYVCFRTAKFHYSVTTRPWSTRLLCCKAFDTFCRKFSHSF